MNNSNHNDPCNRQSITIGNFRDERNEMLKNFEFKRDSAKGTVVLGIMGMFGTTIFDIASPYLLIASGAVTAYGLLCKCIFSNKIKKMHKNEENLKQLTVISSNTFKNDHQHSFLPN